MIDVPSRTGLAALTEAANAVVPSVALGFARSLDDARVSVLYSYSHGIGEFVLAAPDVPDVLLPSTDGPGQADAAAIDSNRLRAVEGFLLANGRSARRVDSRCRMRASDPFLGWLVRPEPVDWRPTGSPRDGGRKW